MGGGGGGGGVGRKQRGEPFPLFYILLTGYSNSDTIMADPGEGVVQLV